MSDLPDLHVKVQFGRAVPNSAQSRSMLGMEKMLREITGMDIQVFKETMADDSKLRRTMTPEQRAKL